MALRVVTRRDARDAAQRALQALRDRGIYRDRARAEGLAALGVVGTVPEVEALHAALAACVDALPKQPADTRTREQKMLDVLLDLVLRPAESGVPPVRVLLTLVAPLQTVLGGDQPAELNGRVVPAETARQLLDSVAGARLGEGALAELRQLADEVPPASPASGGRFVDEPGWEPWEPSMPGAFAAREGEFDDPDPMPDEVWAASVEARLASGEVDLELEHDLAVAQDRWWREFEADLHPDPDQREEPPSGELVGDPLLRSGRWVAADRAVDDASRAVLDARQALGRAERPVRTAARADTADETAWRSSAPGRVDAAADALEALARAAAEDRVALADLLERTTGGGLAERPRIALVDALTGALVSLTDLSGLRRAAHCGRPACRKRPDACEHDLTGRPWLGAPPPTDGYRPGAELDRYIRTRDRRCRFPGCRRRVTAGEIDHSLRWPDGPTDVPHLVGLCTGDHRGKHQASGFSFDTTGDGTLVLTTPSGITATTDAPPF